MLLPSNSSNMYANYRRVILPATPKSTMPTPGPTTPTQGPTPAPDLFIRCNHCSRPFIHSQNVRGVVVKVGDPNTRYYVADRIPHVFDRIDGEIISERIRAANQETDLALTRTFCFRCRRPAGWKVRQRSESHPIVDVGQILLPVPSHQT